MKKLLLASTLLITTPVMANPYYSNGNPYSNPPQNYTKHSTENGDGTSNTYYSNGQSSQTFNMGDGRDMTVFNDGSSVEEF